MANTTNFNWETPDDTDLVKDGAAAIRTLGNSIDTSLVDLKGGTTGQNLRKASNTDLDFTFAGDATNTVVDAAGDLLYGTAADTLGRLAIGTAGQVLKVNSGATAPEWGAASSSMVGWSLGNTSSQSISGTTWTAITWSTESIDTNGFHSTVTNTSRATIPSGYAGKYQINATINWDDNATGKRNLAIYKNGSAVLFTVISASANSPSENSSLILDLAVNDYIEVYVWQNSGGTRTAFAETNYGHFSGVFLGA